MTSSNRRVVITGLGLISPLGHCATSLWEALVAGTSGVRPIQAIPMGHFQAEFGGECQDFTADIANFGTLEKKLQRSIKKGMKLMCRDIQLGVAAAQLALADSGLEPGSFDPTRIGTVFGSDYIMTSPGEFAAGIQKCMPNSDFDFSHWGENGISQVEPLWLLKYLPNMPASHVAIYNDLRGPSNSLTMREASANLAIAEATTIIQRGNADLMIAGATGSRIHPLRAVHLALQEQLADCNTDAAGGDPAKACRPFDSNRNGAVLGEGSGIVVLESHESATARNATIYGEIAGYGSSSVANIQGVADYQSAITNSILGALETSRLDPSQIGHVHAHGSSGYRCDEEEAKAISKTLGQVPVTAAKSYFGNLGAGSGIVELVASLFAMKNQKLFPILNCDDPDSNCPINVVQSWAQSPGNSFINLNVTPVGQASSVVVKAA